MFERYDRCISFSPLTTSALRGKSEEGDPQESLHASFICFCNFCTLFQIHIQLNLGITNSMGPKEHF